MTKGICYIIGAGDNYGLDFTSSSNDFVIAADAGLRYLEQCGITADLVIGDFDSLDNTPTHPNTMALDAEKDETDMFAAVREGIKAGYSIFYIYGGTGGRIDHTTANLQVLAYLAQNGMRGFLFSKDSVITAIADREMTFEAIPSGYISVFSYTQKSEGVYLQGMKYNLDNAGLPREAIGKLFFS